MKSDQSMAASFSPMYESLAEHLWRESRSERYFLQHWKVVGKLPNSGRGRREISADRFKSNRGAR